MAAPNCRHPRQRVQAGKPMPMRDGSRVLEQGGPSSSQPRGEVADGVADGFLCRQRPPRRPVGGHRVLRTPWRWVRPRASDCPCSVREQVPPHANSNQERTSKQRKTLGSYRCVSVAVSIGARLLISGSQVRSLRGPFALSSTCVAPAGCRPLVATAFTVGLEEHVREQLAALDCERPEF